MKRIFLMCLGLLFMARVAYSNPSNQINTPNTFVPNTVIQSSQVNANSSEVQSKYNSHTHTDLTQLGTIVVGGWNASLITPQYGGTGANLSAVTSSNILGFTGTGVIGAVPTSSLQTAKDAILRGFEVVSAGTVTVNVNPGSLLVGTTLVDAVSSAVLTLSSGASWYDGNTHTYGGGAGMCYIGVDSNGNTKLLATNAPNYSDTNGHNTGDLLYWYYTTNSDYFRIIGAVHVSTANQLDLSWQQIGNHFIYTDPQLNSIVEVLNGGTASTFTGVSCSSVVPIGAGSVDIVGNSAAGGTAFWFRETGSLAINGILVSANANGSFLIPPLTLPVNSSQSFDYYMTNTGVGNNLYVAGYTVKWR